MTRRRYQPRKQVVTRFVVAKDYYSNGYNMREDFPVLYGTQAEAEEMMAKLNAGSDISFFDASDEDAAAFLYVDSICVELTP